MMSTKRSDAAGSPAIVRRKVSTARAHRGDRRAQLVRDVGDEVLAQGLEPPRLGHVDEHREQTLVLAVDHGQRRRVHQQPARPRPVVSISPVIGPLAARARSRIDGSSALRISSSAARPSASAGISSVARSAGLTSSMRPSSSSTSTPSRIDSRINPSRSRSLRRAVSVAARFAGHQIQRPSQLGDFVVATGRRRTAESPAAMRRATPVIRRERPRQHLRDRRRATIATTSATSSAPHMMWRTAPTAARPRRSAPPGGPRPGRRRAAPSESPRT